jgi:FtsZ-binding cell division protein ZapB
MSELTTAQERLEAAIGHLEEALETRADDDRAARQEAASLKAANEAVTERLEAAIGRLQALLGA